MSRLEEFDWIRAIATFTVIGIHVTAAYVLISPYGYISNQLARFAVPLFIVMSGFLLQYTDCIKPLDTKSFYAKRMKKIIRPYIIWTAIYYIAGLYLNNTPFRLTDLAYDIGLGTAFYHLYFVVIILQLYLLFPVLKFGFKRNQSITVIVGLALTVICQVVLYYNMMGYKLLPAKYTDVYLIIFPVWIFYFIFGMLGARNMERWGEYIKANPFTVIIGWLLSLGLLLWDSKMTLTYGSSIRPSVILYTITSYFFLYYLATKFKGYIKDFVIWFSKQSFLVYLIHPLILTGLIVLPPYMGMPDIWAYTKGMVFQYIVTVLLTIIAVYIISLTPFAELLGGIRKVRREE